MKSTNEILRTFVDNLMGLLEELKEQLEEAAIYENDPDSYEEDL